MIFNIKNTAGKKVHVYDCHGTEIKCVASYNTKTREVKMYLTGKHPAINCDKTIMTRKSHNKWRLVKIKVKLQGSYIVVDGKKY